jgi:hypothetical protein
VGAGGAASDTAGGSSADAGSHQRCWYRWHIQLGFSDWRNCEYTGVQANRNSGAGTAPHVLRSGCLALVSAPPKHLLDPLDNKLHFAGLSRRGFLCSELFFGI